MSMRTSGGRVGVAMAMAAAAIAGAGCGGASRSGGSGDGGFDCRDRWASYLVVGSLAGAELGVAMDCGQVGPRLRRWVVGKDGTRDEHARSMSPGEFEDVWGRIEGAGWRFLEDCDAEAAATDPIYTFDVKDWNGSVSFSCAGRGALPFPYGGLVDELDQAAATLPGGDRGEEADDDLEGAPAAPAPPATKKGRRR
jgi:hypothetical protein